MASSVSSLFPKLGRPRSLGPLSWVCFWREAVVGHLCSQTLCCAQQFSGQNQGHCRPCCAARLKLVAAALRFQASESRHGWSGFAADPAAAAGRSVAARLSAGLQGSLPSGALIRAAITGPGAKAGRAPWTSRSAALVPPVAWSRPAVERKAPVESPEPLRRWGAQALPQRRCVRAALAERTLSRAVPQPRCPWRTRVAVSVCALAVPNLLCACHCGWALQHSECPEILPEPPREAVSAPPSRQLRGTVQRGCSTRFLQRFVSCCFKTGTMVRTLRFAVVLPGQQNILRWRFVKGCLQLTGIFPI